MTLSAFIVLHGVSFPDAAGWPSALATGDKALGAPPLSRGLLLIGSMRINVLWLINYIQEGK